MPEEPTVPGGVQFCRAEADTRNIVFPGRYGATIHPESSLRRSAARLPMLYRLLASFLLIIAVFSVAIAVVWVSVGQIFDGQERYLLTAERADEVAGAAYNMRISQAQDVLVRGHVENPDGSDMHRGDVAAFERALAALGASVHDQQSRSAYAEVTARYAEWDRIDRRIHTLIAAGHIAGATRLESGPGNTLGDALAQGMPKLAKEQLAASAARTAAHAARGQRDLGLLALAGLIVAAAFAGVTTRSITRPLRRIAHASLNVAAGEFGARVQNGGGGRELMNVAAAFNHMAENIEQSQTEIKARLQEEGAFGRVATAVAERADVMRVFEILAMEGAGLVCAETGAVVRFSDAGAGDVVGSWAASGAVRMDVGTVVPLVGAGANAQVARTGQAARVGSYASAEPDLVRLVGGHGYRSGIAAPVQTEGRLWGALWVATTGAEPLPAQAEERLRRFAELVGLAVSSTEAWERLEGLAFTDPLTGLPNRRVFHDRLEIEAERARRHGRPLSVAMLDIDHFKVVNDIHGHDVGDDVLSEIARRLTLIVRGGEVIARVGGEEFAWLLPETGGAAAFAAAERARHVIGDTPFDGVGTLTISAGVCDIEQAGSDNQLLQFADTALYWAKAHGRDATCRYAQEVFQLGVAEILLASEPPGNVGGKPVASDSGAFSG